MKSVSTTSNLELFAGDFVTSINGQLSFATSNVVSDLFEADAGEMIIMRLPLPESEHVTAVEEADVQPLAKRPKAWNIPESDESEEL